MLSLRAAEAAAVRGLMRYHRAGWRADAARPAEPAAAAGPARDIGSRGPRLPGAGRAGERGGSAEEGSGPWTWMILKSCTPRSGGFSFGEKWYVIGEGVPHEFFPEGEDMAVVSFHTCAAEELEEVASGSGARRIYELPGGGRSRAAAGPDRAADRGRDTGS